MPSRQECYMYLQVRAGADGNVCVLVCLCVFACVFVCGIPWSVIIARWSCLYNKIKEGKCKMHEWGEEGGEEETM